MLSQEYRPVATMEGAAMGSHAIIHALLGDADKTMCESVDSLDTVTMVGRSVNCGNCNAALKKERQRRSAAGQAEADRKREAQANADADWRARRTADEVAQDQDLIDAMQGRARRFEESGDNAMGAMLANTALIMQKNLDQ